MDFLNTYLGSDTYIVVLILAIFGVMLLLTLYLAVFRKLQALRSKARGASQAWAEQSALEFILSRHGQLPANLPRSDAYKDFLAKVGSRFTGDLNLRVMIIYTCLGFADGDIKALRSGSLAASIKALKRCRDLGLPLPDSVWAGLLGSTSRTLRWAAMDYLIAIKGKKSAIRLVQFLSNPENQKRGMALHLLSQLAERSPAALVAICQHSDSDFLRNICLESLGTYPIAGAEAALIDIARGGYGTKTFLLALTAVAAIPSPLSQDFLLSLVGDFAWEVRELVAKALGTFGGDNGLAALEILSEDISYPVRYQAVASIAAVGAVGEALLQRIGADPLHPSSSIVQDFLTTQTSSRAA